MYKYIFGPVPSRRLGMSLGVDLVPHKVCTFNCVYCECGKTTLLTTERKEYVPFDEVIRELDHYMSNNPPPDYFTFSGAGEPTLNSRVGDILRFIKSKFPDIPVAVLTNGSLFVNKNARAELLDADLVLPSLDAGTDMAFLKIDRPHKSFKIKEYITGLINFSQEYSGKIWLEILILPGYNDSTDDLISLKSAILKIKPEKIQLNTIDRPGTIERLRPANKLELQHIIDTWELKNVEIIAAAPERKKIKSYRNDTETAIMETISRRPCTLEDLSNILGLHINEINKYLGILDNENKIEAIKQDRGLFYQSKNK